MPEKMIDPMCTCGARQSDPVHVASHMFVLSCFEGADVFDKLAGQGMEVSGAGTVDESLAAPPHHPMCRCNAYPITDDMPAGEANVRDAANRRIAAAAAAAPHPLATSVDVGTERPRSDYRDIAIWAAKEKSNRYAGLYGRLNNLSPLTKMQDIDRIISDTLADVEDVDALMRQALFDADVWAEVRDDG